MSIHWGGRGAGHVSRWSASTTGVPSLVLDFITTTSLDSRITFTRALNTATRVNSSGLIEIVNANVPRFDYDPVTLAAKGLLIEEQRTNLIEFSEQFDNFNSVTSNATVTANVGTSPDGTVNADKLIPAAIAGQAKAIKTITASAANNVMTVYAKPNGYDWIILQASGFAWFNVSTGTVGTQTSCTGSITPAGNGWYRCQIKCTSSSTLGVVWVTTGNGVTTMTGNGTSGVLIWGAQIENGTFATSYIPTVAGTVTRNADIATMTGTNFSSWFNASEGTFVASYGTSPNQFATYIAASNGVVGQNSVHFDNDSGGDMRAVYYSGSVAQAILSLGAYGTAGTVNTVASAYAVDDFAASRNGGTVVTDTSGALPVSLTQFNIGADPSGAAVNVSNSHIRSITYYNKRLYNPQLQTLSQ